jgi:uncharacterized protein (DUF934 family)
MPLIDSNGRNLPDPWTSPAEHEAIPDSGPVLVSLRRWQTDRERLRDRSDPVGILFESNENPVDIGPDLQQLSLIALRFPKFTDGRPYSTARLLRERCNYAGELRAVGAVLRDQLLFLKRCGFDTFEIAKAQSGSDLSRAFSELSVAYQPAADRTERTADVRLSDRTGYQSSKVCAAFWAY